MGLTFGQRKVIPLRWSTNMGDIAS